MANKSVDEILRSSKWVKELGLLREIALECSLEEEVKWKQACYCYKGANVLILASFKNHCTISFFKGAIMADPEGLMVSPGENSNHVKMIKFTDIEQIASKRDEIKAYIYEAIELERLGLKVEVKDKGLPNFPVELLDKFKDDQQLKDAFHALTPGRQRAYLMHFNSTKQSKTRESRIIKCTPRILVNKGLNDCICGMSKRMPNCDGSHKYLK